MATFQLRVFHIRTCTHGKFSIFLNFTQVLITSTHTDETLYKLNSILLFFCLIDIIQNDLDFPVHTRTYEKRLNGKEPYLIGLSLNTIIFSNNVIPFKSNYKITNE